MTKNNRAASERFKEIVKVLSHYDLIHGVTPEKLRRILEELGATFVKFGQIMSMRPDMIPAGYCEELEKLRTDAKPMDFAQTRLVLTEEYGEPPENFFSRIEETPFGSASIAQVHKATLRDGRSVVIKVQRPGIHDTMAQDVKLLHRISGLLRMVSRAGKVVDFDAVIDEMWAAAQQEMDFLLEAEHIREFTECNADIRYIGFPGVERPLTTRRVLVMEMVEGIAVNDTKALEAGGYDLKEIAAKIGANYIKQIVDDGLFHADPHPGNIRISGGRIVWIDLGMVGRLSPRHRRLFKEAVVAAADNDIRALGDIVIVLGNCSGEADHSRLYTEIGDMMSRYGALELGDIDAGTLLLDLLRIAEGNGVTMPPGISMLARGVMTIEGVLSRIDPETNFLSIIAANTAGSLWQDTDLTGAIKRGGRALHAFSKKAADIPMQMSDILRMASRGQAKVNFEMVGSEAPLSRLEHAANRLIVGILSGCLVIGSSILCTTDMTPRLFGIPLLGVLGFAAALIMTVWLVVRILQKKRL
jgi:Predicted unusual protein kinase